MSAKNRTKRLAALDAPPVLTSKRKRTTVSYAEVVDDPSPISDDEEPKLVDETTMVDSDEDEDQDFSVGRKAKRNTKAPPKKKIKKAPKPKKVKRFRFLDLPPELRDMIYEMALVEPNDVSIVARTRAHRQKPLRGPVYSDSDHRVTGWGRSRTIHHGTDQLSPISTTFTPALLAVNKQINAEAINYLYGHEFIFENCTALAEFLVAIGHRNSQRLDTVRVMSWGSGSSASNAANRYGLAMLAGATNLTALILDCAIGGSSPGKMAALLFRDGHHFIRAYGVANGSKHAAVDIIELHDKNFRVYHTKQPSEQEQRESFEKSLRAFAKTL